MTTVVRRTQERASPFAPPVDPGAPVMVAEPRRLESRRQLRGGRVEERLALVGAVAAALALACLICLVLLPWGDPLAFVVVAYLSFLGVYALLVSFDGPATQVKDRLASVLAHSLGGLLLLSLVVVVVFTFYRGFPALRHLNFYLQDLSEAGPLQALTEGGVLHAMAGTAIMIAIAIVITVPVSVVTAVYLAESRGPFARLVRTVIEAMTALPSVIAGLFIYATIISLQQAFGRGQLSGLAAAVALSVMMTPIVVRAADVVLRLVPGNLKEAALALGAPRWRVAWHVVMPTSRSGLTTAIILGTARGIGETSPVLLVAGYTTSFNLDPTSGPMTSLPLTAFILTRSPEPREVARGFGAAAILMVIVFVLFALARIVGGRGPGVLSNRQRRRAVSASRQDLARYDARQRREAVAAYAEPSPGAGPDTPTDPVPDAPLPARRAARRRPTPPSGRHTS